ncbi:hypothetical protein LTR53_016423, partial [Teratosphaeriaceae sp. CCFEE 6253]
MEKGDESSAGNAHQAPVANHARDWIDASDPGNPRNFSINRRIYSTLAVTVLAFVTTFAASVYTPGLEDVAKEFGV